jgi:hypothetical protein
MTALFRSYTTRTHRQRQPANACYQQYYQQKDNELFQFLIH